MRNHAPDRWCTTSPCFVHLTAVIIWIGGLVAIGILNARLAREEGSSMAPIARASRFFGQAVVGPAAVLTLIAASSWL